MESVLALIHGGKSFVHQISQACQELGLSLSVASSAISDEQKIAELASLVPVLHVGTESDLSFAEVKTFIEDQRIKGNTITAVISVWENYRPLMAQLNQLLGCEDLSPTQVTLLRDKFQMRQTLRQGNLSLVNSQKLTKELFEKLKANATPSFVKPCQGIASFGAFKLGNHIQWEDVIELVASIQQDSAYSSSFTKDVDFIVEDYIGGTEYCLEMIAYQGNSHIIAIHEKVEVESINRLTILENVSATPPISLSQKQIEGVDRWIKQVFNLFGISFGCFHVEAKLDKHGWEIIEINPRVGGAYINESVEYVTGFSLLNLWLRVLTATAATQQNNNALLQQLDVCRGQRTKGAFFRVFYAEPGRTIRDLYFKNGLPPLHSKVLMSPGTQIPDLDRELYIAQGLWPWSGDITNAEELFTRVAASAQEFEVVYE